jgi:hypothetical protein
MCGNHDCIPLFIGRFKITFFIEFIPAHHFDPYTTRGFGRTGKGYFISAISKFTRYRQRHLLFLWKYPCLSWPFPLLRIILCHEAFHNASKNFIRDYHNLRNGKRRRFSTFLYLRKNILIFDIYSGQKWSLTTNLSKYYNSN